MWSKVLLSRFPLLLLSATTSAYKLLLVRCHGLAPLSQPNLGHKSTACILQPGFYCHWSTIFFLSWQLWIAWQYSLFLGKYFQQTGHHKTLHLRSPKHRTENWLSSNITKYWGGGKFTLQTSRWSFKLEVYYCQFIEKHRLVQKHTWVQ